MDLILSPNETIDELGKQKQKNKKNDLVDKYNVIKELIEYTEDSGD